MRRRYRDGAAAFAALLPRCIEAQGRGATTSPHTASAGAAEAAPRGRDTDNELETP